MKPCAWCGELAIAPVRRYGATYCSPDHADRGRWEDRGNSPYERLGKLIGRVEREDPRGQGYVTGCLLRARLALLQADPAKAAATARAAAEAWRIQQPADPLTEVYLEAADLCEAHARAAGNIAEAV